MDEPLAAIVSTKEKHEDRLLKMPGVTGVDVGYKYTGGVRTDEVAIRVMVEKKDPSLPPEQRVPAELDGVRTDVIERTYFLQDARNRRKVDDVALDADTGNYAQVKGGIGIGPCRAVGGYVYVGTLGAIVKDNATGNPMLLSNFHVMCIDDGWHVGDTMAQPSRVDGGSCPANVVGTLQRAQLTAQVDCAVSSLSGRGYSCEIVDIGRVAGTATAVLGAPVRKRGRTTGLTYGVVDSIALSVNIDYGSTLGVRTLTNQIGIRPDTAHNASFGDHGDSGSAVVDGSLHVVGLHFAGSSDGHGIANPIGAVLGALGVSMCTSVSKAPIKEVKDFKEVEKLPLKDVKDTKQIKSEIKEVEKLPAKELRDAKPVKVELKEVEKPAVDHFPGKGLVENPGKLADGPGTGPIQNPVGPADAGLKAIDGKLQKDKDVEKFLIHEGKQVKDAKDHKEGKDTKDHKEGKDSKDHKEGKDNKDAKEHKEVKEHKDVKDHKHEGKELAKNENKELSKAEGWEGKVSFENDPKGPFETGPFQPGGSGEADETGQRMARLEATVAALSTFITSDLRPDLGAGALTNEKPDSPCHC